MFQSMKRLKKDERILLFLGIVLTIVVFYFINYAYMGQGMIFWALAEAGIMWVIIISLLVMADNQRVLNNELKEILRENIDEAKTLKEISREQLQEIKLLKGAFTKKRSSKK